MTLSRSATHVLAAIFLIAILLRFPWLGLKSLWLDEAASVYYATPVFENVDSVHPPLYYVFVHYTMAFLGRSEAAIRLPSALFSILNVALLYWLGRKLFNRQVGLLAAALLAVSPLDIWYAQEARMYAAVACATLCMALGLSWRHWAGFLLYFLGLLAGLHLIYFFAPIWLALSALWLVNWQRRDGKPLHLVLWVAASAAAWAAFLPWLPQLWRWIENTLGGHWILAPVRALQGGSQLSPLHFGAIVAMVTATLIVAALSMPTILRQRQWRRLITVLALALFVGMILFVPLPRLYALKRILYTSWALVVLCVAWLVLQLQQRRGAVIGLLLGLSLASSLVAIFLVPKDDWRGVARAMQQQTPGAVLWVDPRWNNIVYRYYDPGREVLNESNADIDTVAAQNAELWLVAERFHGRPAPSSPSEAWLDEHMVLQEVLPFYRLELRRYHRPP